ncbi:uncharacterized protein N7503_005240 [Penicillium pulvis]|uniref:uncharacterized protein n=1 Tax=Penicillium pulvis TaxID=1562058 RepID=UPI0025494E3D|nr:uncharacterized protein N7503_005240 [Penicillium pulvis]KAJ5802790.1 hypothetical protein N7503_005240 [Penicillium pulvis]
MFGKPRRNFGSIPLTPPVTIERPTRPDHAENEDPTTPTRGPAGRGPSNPHNAAAGPSNPFRRPLTLRDTERLEEDNFRGNFNTDGIEGANPEDAHNKGKGSTLPIDETLLGTSVGPRLGTVYERGPNETQFGKGKTIPAATVGHKVLPPGPWAELVMTTPFSVAVEGELIKSDLLIKLRTMPPRQELVLRFGRKVVTTGLVLIQEINKSINNVEATHIQVNAQYRLASRYAVPRRVIDKISALKAEAVILLEKIQELKEEFRKTDDYTVETIESNPEATLPALSPEVHEQKMKDYFRLLRFNFLNKLRGKFGKGDRDFAKIEDRAQNLIEMIDDLTL